jgi:hypothetical protein
MTQASKNGISDRRLLVHDKSELLQDIHDHPADQSCHWVSIFKPLSFIVFRDAQLAQHIFHGVSHRPPIRFGAGDFRAYAKWLGESGENGMVNLIHVFLLICELHGSPQ